MEDNRFWQINACRASILAHPTLKSLKLSCAELDDNVGASLENKSPTPLKHLALIECHITQGALRSILALPSGLEVLSLGENCNHSRQWHYTTDTDVTHTPLMRDPQAFFASLKQQNHSLKSFAYATPAHPIGMAPLTLPDPEAKDFSGFSTFSSLVSLSIEGCAESFGRLLSDSRSAPPALRHFHFAQKSSDSFIFTRDAQMADSADLAEQPKPWWFAVCEMNHSLRDMELVVNVHDHRRLYRQGAMDKFVGYVYVYSAPQNI